MASAASLEKAANGRESGADVAYSPQLSGERKREGEEGEEGERLGWLTVGHDKACRSSGKPVVDGALDPSDNNFVHVQEWVRYAAASSS